MGAAGFGGSFAPIVQYEKWEIHPVFPHFSYFRLCQNTARISLPHYAVLPKVDQNFRFFFLRLGFRVPARKSRAEVAMMARVSTRISTPKMLLPSVAR